MTRRVSISKSITQGESLPQFYQRVRNGGAQRAGEEAVRKMFGGGECDT